MINYKAYDTVWKEWIDIKSFGFLGEGELWYVQGQDSNELEIDPPYFTDACGTEWELLVYTGVNDIKGVPIYSGSIVEISDHPFQRESGSGVGIDINGRYVIRWSDHDLTWLAGEFLLSKLRPYVTHIGYACENPELLKGAKEHGN